MPKTSPAGPGVYCWFEQAASGTLQLLRPARQFPVAVALLSMGHRMFIQMAQP